MAFGVGSLDDDVIGQGSAAALVDLSGVLVQGGMHLATYYSTEEGRLRIAAPFLREGLSSGQPCFLIASGEVLDRYVEALEEGLTAELAEARRRGLFVTAPAPGRTVEEALAFWNQSIWDALSHGTHPPVVRIVGDMACVKSSFATVQQMLVFERLVGAVIKSFPAVAVCQYDVREFDGASLLEAMKAHPDVSALGFDKFVT
ncbi:MAG TPA: MEDS domain-containing protein [Candidatus Solibacter sp.]|nr:MEDS domain-containing protein [Candidatus Solibacter sp.]